MYAKNEKPQNVSERIGLIELSFSGHHQDKEYQKINTRTLNDLIFTIKEQKEEIRALKNNSHSYTMTFDYIDGKFKNFKTVKNIK